jgi:hypothetical protein
MLWTDPRLIPLGSSAKLTFMYAWTCPHGNWAGVYYLRPEMIAMETGLALSDVGPAIQELIQAKLIEYDPERYVIWVVEFHGMQARGSTTAASVAKAMGLLHNSPLCQRFYERYPESARAAVGPPAETPSTPAPIPSRYPNDTPPIPPRYPPEGSGGGSRGALCRIDKVQGTPTIEQAKPNTDDDDKGHSKKISNTENRTSNTDRGGNGHETTLTLDRERDKVYAGLCRELRIVQPPPGSSDAQQAQYLSDAHYVRGLLKCIMDDCRQSGGFEAQDWQEALKLAHRASTGKVPVAAFRSQAKKLWTDPSVNAKHKKGDRRHAYRD